MSRGAPPQINFAFPLKGQNTNLQPGDQPKGTSQDLLNVRPFNVQKGQATGGRRPGTVKLFSAALIGPVRAMLQATVPGSTYAANADIDSSPMNQLGWTTGTVGQLATASLPAVDRRWRTSRGAAGDYFALATADDNCWWFADFVAQPSSAGAAGTYQAAVYMKGTTGTTSTCRRPRRTTSPCSSVSPSTTSRRPRTRPAGTSPCSRGWTAPARRRRRRWLPSAARSTAPRA